MIELSLILFQGGSSPEELTDATPIQFFSVLELTPLSFQGAHNTCFDNENIQKEWGEMMQQIKESVSKFDERFCLRKNNYKTGGKKNNIPQTKNYFKNWKEGEEIIFSGGQPNNMLS